MNINYFQSLEFLQIIIKILGWIWIGGFFGIYVFHSWAIIVPTAIIWTILKGYQKYEYPESIEKPVKVGNVVNICLVYRQSHIWKLGKLRIPVTLIKIELL
jgi:hypothetical protein